MWIDIRGQGRCLLLQRDNTRGGHLRHWGNIAITAQSWGDKTISPHRGIISPDFGNRDSRQQWLGSVFHLIRTLHFTFDLRPVKNTWNSIHNWRLLCKMFEVNVKKLSSTYLFQQFLFINGKSLALSFILLRDLCLQYHFPCSGDRGHSENVWGVMSDMCHDGSWRVWHVSTISVSLLSPSFTFLLTPEYFLLKDLLYTRSKFLWTLN